MLLRTLFLVPVVALPWAVITWGIVDAARQPRVAWQNQGQQRMLWIALPSLAVLLSIVMLAVSPLLAGLLGLVALVSSVVYLTVVRSQLNHAELKEI